MVKLESLKKSSHFRKTLKDKKVHSEFFSIFAVKNFIQPKNKNNLIVSFLMKKKNWQCCKKK
jgi:RNase P protein component